MTHVIVTSQNPAKISAVKAAFYDVFPNTDFTFTGVSVPSDVADQPMTEKETYAGACNRVQHAKVKYEGDFYVGVEAGLDHQHTFAWMVIDDGTTRGEARSASLPLPQEALRALHHGEELGDVMDRMFNGRHRYAYRTPINAIKRVSSSFDHGTDPVYASTPLSLKTQR